MGDSTRAGSASRPSVASSSNNAVQDVLQAQSGPAAAPAGAAPTLVYYGDRVVRVRIDRDVPLVEIIRQLCASPQLAVKEGAALFAIRDSVSNELITADNLAGKLDNAATFKLVAAPNIEACEIIDRLQGTDKQAIKQATFALRGYIREEPFLEEFLKRAGVAALATAIQDASGNSLAYALAAIQSILDLDQGYDNLDERFVRRIVYVTSTQALVNIVRPALAIVRRLILSEHPRFGFLAVWPCIVQADGFFKALTSRITREGDKLLTSAALALVNSLLKTIPPDRLLPTVEKLEMYNFRRAVISLIETRAEDVTPQVLQFQQNHASLWYEMQSTEVDLSTIKHIAMLQVIYEQAGLNGQKDSPDQYDYRRLGFLSNSPEISNDFQGVGVFGLHVLHHIATTRQEDFARMVREQVNRPDRKRCPIAVVSLQVSRILSDQFDFSGSLASASFQPFLLDYYRIHFVVMEFFVRMYSESGATLTDFERVSTLATSQVRLSLGRGALDYQSPEAENEPKTFFALKQEFDEARYEEVRDRQMKEMEIEDDLLSKLPVRNLRDRLYRESFEFVKQQRIHCLQLGAWFSVPPLKSAASASARQRAASVPARYRFYRLAPNRRYLHYLEAGERYAVSAGLDALPDKIDLTMVSEVFARGSTRTSLTQQQSRSDIASPLLSSSSASLRNSTSTMPAGSDNPLGITLVSQDSIIAEIIAFDQAQFSEWLDGLNLLLPDGFIATRETADFIQTLTDVGVKIKLLDLTGERLEIPTAIPTPIVPPPSVPFYYAE